MKYARYLRLEKYISAADTGGIIERWRYGRRLLLDDTAMTPSRKSLKHGVIDRLLGHAKAKGYRLSEQEIQRRLRAARAYPTEAQIRHAVTDFEAWRDLVSAGFPEYERPEGEPDYDPRDTDEIERDASNAGRRLLPELSEDAEQLSLFPDDRFGPLSTLAELAKYADEMRELTARFAARDDERADYLRRLIDAVGGDMSTTWQDAQRALTERDDETAS